MANLTQVIKITQSDYNTLVGGGSITKGGVTYTYDANALYLVEDSSTPVVSVNNVTADSNGNISLTASNVGALPSNTTYVSTVNGSSGAVSLSIPANYTSTSKTPSQCTANGFYYVSSSTSGLSGADSNPFLQYHSSNADFRILTTAYSEQWLQQIATDFRTNHVFYRIKNNGTWGNWIEIANSDTNTYGVKIGSASATYDSTNECIKFTF